MSRAQRPWHGFLLAGSVAAHAASASAEPAKAAAPAAPAHVAAPPAAEDKPAAPGAPAEKVVPPVAATATATAAPAPVEAPSEPAPASAVAAPPQAPAPEPQKAAAAPGDTSETPSSLEISGSVGPTFVFQKAANPEYVESTNRLGLYGEFAVGYRSSYFIDPFLAVSYASLASGRAVLPSGPYGSGGTLDQHVGAWVIAPGITTDIWRFRLRFGIGIGVVVQDFKFNDQANSTTQTPFASQFGLGFNFLDQKRLRIDAEARYIALPGADLNFVTLAFVVRGDLLVFGRSH
jgi:hypothetical protein